jgi:hypothetical protein
MQCDSVARPVSPIDAPAVKQGHPTMSVELGLAHHHRFRGVMRALSALALAVCLTAPAAARAELLERFALQEFGAVAEWHYFDAEGTETFVSVVVSQSSLSRNTAGGPPSPALAVSIFSVDAEGFVVFSGTGVTDTFQYDFDRNLGTAHVTGNLLVADEGQGTTEEFSVNLSWKAKGGITSNNGTSHFREGEFVSVFNTQGLQRPGSAVGTVFGKGVEWTSNLPSTSALLLKNTVGDLIVITGNVDSL